VPPSAAGATTLLSVEKIDTFYGKSHIIKGGCRSMYPRTEIVALLGRMG